MAQQALQFKRDIQITKHIRLQFLLHVPEQAKLSHTKWPLILFLHGRDQRGDNPDLLKIRGLPLLLEEQPDFPFIVVTPQCPGYYIWPFVFDGVIALLEEVVANYPVDQNRIYLTGLSMGGYATWDLAMEYPQRFAAIAPVCGSTSTERLEDLKHMPVWAFHGEKDDVVPLESAVEVIEALKRTGGSAKITIYPNGGHDAWTETYSDPALYQWFLQHKRKSK